MSAPEKPFSSISFFCPAYNEEKNLPVLIPKAHALLSSLTDTFEILIVENGSTDHTRDVAHDLASRFPQVRVLEYPHGLGYGGAVREGFRNARYDYICYTDGDNQYDVDEFVDGFKLMGDADIASGYVRAKAVSMYRKFQSGVFNAVLSLLFFTRIRDINCSMKIYKRSALDKIEIKSVSAFIDAEMLIRARRKGLKIVQYPVTHFERTSGVAIGSKPSVIFETLIEMLKFRFGRL